MKIRQNFHIHSHHSCDSACSTLKDIQNEQDALGVEEFGLTDHLHTRYNLPDIVSACRDWLGLRPHKNFHFGVEITCMTQWECEKIASGDFTPDGDEPIYGFRWDVPREGRYCLDITKEEIRNNGIEFVVAGVHWPDGFPKTLADSIDNLFVQEMFLASHPLVDVVAHPWYPLEMTAGDWFRHRDQAHIDWSAHKAIPQELNDRLGAEMLKHGKLAEINLAEILNPPEFVGKLRMECYARWREAGLKFTIGSDQHSAHADPKMFAAAEKLLDRYGFRESDFALPIRTLK